MNLKQIRSQIREIRREMRELGIRRISCFNGGLSNDEYRYNAKLFDLNTRLRDSLTLEAETK